MKKLIALVLILAVLLTLCACETRQEKAQREIREANAAYRDAQRDLDRLETELDIVQWKIKQIEGD